MKRLMHNRIISFLLALVLLVSDVPSSVFAGANDGNGTTSDNSAGTTQSQLQYDYDTMYITREGEQIRELSLLSHEKIEITAGGVTEEVKYQWQVEHPEQDGVWVNVYDATEKTISVTMALVENVLRENGTAKLRCRAYTDTYAYLSNTVTVSVDVTENYVAQTMTKSGVMLAADGEETPEFVTVTIEYILYENILQDDDVTFVETEMGNAFTSYVATLQYDTSLNAKVHCPTIVGYAPVLKKVTEDGVERDPNGDEFDAEDNVVVKQSNIKGNVVYRVEYHPDFVNYEVRYFFQNIYDDLYTENATLVKDTLGKTEYPVIDQGKTGTHPNKGYTEATFTGFTSLYYEPEVIAADGSTSFHVYYERNYYLMEFHCNGGYGTDTIYVRYGTHISVPNPSKSGYEFAGWNLGTLQLDANGNPAKDSEGRVIINYGSLPSDMNNFVGATLPSSMPHENRYYRAEWKSVNASYTIAYWIVESDGNLTYIGGRTEYKDSGTPVSGEHDLGLKDKGGKPMCDNSEHSHGNECYLDVRNMETIDTFTVTKKNGEMVTYTTSKNVLVEGDGSTVLNVYYQYKEYTLKFYYAMSEAQTDGNTYYRIVGGSTNYFGKYDQNTANDLTLLRNVFITHRGETGQTANNVKPSLNQTGMDRVNAKVYTLGEEEDKTYSKIYYYLSFTARYGDDISEKWPVDVFNSVEMDTNNFNTTWGNGKKNVATASGWNGEHHVKYTQEESNQTIKGKYEKLDDKLLFKSDYADETTVSFLCFWENGAKLSNQWNVPKLFRYNVWLEGAATNGERTTVRDGITYYLADFYDTCDDSSVGQQTQGTLTGYTPKYFPKGYREAYNYEQVKDSNPAKYFEYKTLTGTTDKTLLEGDGYYNSDMYDSGVEVNFYYTASEHILKFMNHNAWLTDGTGVSMKYGTSLQQYGAYVNAVFMAQPENYPETLEPGAYKFTGWYTTATFLPGTEMNWSSVMPDNDVTVYAKWEPKIRNVYFYYDYDNYVSALSASQEDKDDYYWYHKDVNGNNKPDQYPIEVTHGRLLGTIYSNNPEPKPGYTFVGWFYIDEQGKKRFAPDTMEVKRELHLFAEWQSGIDTEYRVDYVLDESDGTNPAGTSIAAPTEGHLTAGKTKTFSAKVSTDLYAAFRNVPLFPIVNSHSILMDSEKEHNAYTFRYKRDDKVFYIVRYVNKITGVELSAPKIEESDKAIVTEKFQPFAGFIPENYYSRKVLAYDGPENNSKTPETITEAEINEYNEIIFYYTPDKDHALYTIEYYTQNLDGTWPDIPVESVIGSDDLNKIVSIAIDPNKYNGFTYRESKITTYSKDSSGNYGPNSPTSTNQSTVEGTLTEGGLEIRVYYVRNQYKYTIRYVEHGSGNILGYKILSGDVLHMTNPESMELYGTTIEHTASESVTVDGILYNYYLKKPDQCSHGGACDNPTACLEQEWAAMRTQSLSVRAGDNENVLTFYYQAKQVDVYYVPVCKTVGATDYGKVSVNKETAATVKNISGSNAMAGIGYKFVGWYSDASCTTPVNTDWRYSPGVDESPDVKEPAGTKLKINSLDSNMDEVYYYALFEPITTSLTTTKIVDEATTDNFLFHIQGQGKLSYIDLIVSVGGNDLQDKIGTVLIKDLPVGTYIITELTDWSWEYSDKPAWTLKVEGTMKESSKNPNANDYVAYAEITIDEKGGELTFTTTYMDSDWMENEVSKANKFSGVATP